MMVQAKQPWHTTVPLERLEGEAAEESGGAVGVVPGAVVDVHGDEEDGDAGHGGGGDEPRRPAPVVGPCPDHLLLVVSEWEKE